MWVRIKGQQPMSLYSFTDQLAYMLDQSTCKMIYSQCKVKLIVYDIQHLISPSSIKVQKNSVFGYKTI